MIGWRRLSLTAALLFCLAACASPSPQPTAVPQESPSIVGTPTRPAPATVVPRPTPTGTATVTPIPTDTARPTRPPAPTTVTVEYGVAFGIDYGDPNEYLAQGGQTQLSDPAVLDPLRAPDKTMAHLGEIYHWLQREFAGYSAGGSTIGKATVDGLLQDRQLGGCHDYALVYAAVVRELGYPAVVAESYSIAWIEQFQAGEANQHIGHVFVEVYLAGKWVLVDPTNGWYVEEGYDPADPVIPLKGSIAGPSEEVYGFYVDRKGRDTWDCGFESVSELTQAMDEFAHQLDLETISYPEYAFERFAK